ncbi:Uncharacterised protein [Vibrio cholerae]|nr:Uncharacterised protein [Vibrio cholerae]
MASRCHTQPPKRQNIKAAVGCKYCVARVATKPNRAPKL